MPSKISKAIPLISNEKDEIENDRFPSHAAKKPRLKNHQEKNNGLYEPFRALGFISNKVPVAIQALGQAFFVTTCIGSTFQVYDIDKLQLKMVGDNIANGEAITSLVALGERTFAGTNRGHIYVYSRNRQIDVFTFSEVENIPVVQLLQFGELIVALYKNNICAIWGAHKQTNPLIRHGRIPTKSSAVCMIHPPTHVNKIVIGFKDGSIELWDTAKLKSVGALRNVRDGACLSSLSTSPVLDVIAIGYSDGRILVHNIAVDETLLQFSQKGAVTALSFSSFSGSLSLLASANDVGDIFIWDLDQRSLYCEMFDAHAAAVSSLQFLPQQLLLLSASGDNSIREWYFDQPSAPPRLLRFRSGHSAPPTQVRFHDEVGTSVITCGLDQTLRYFSFIRDAQNTDFSQGKKLAEKARKWQRDSVNELMVPNITRFSIAEAKKKQWDNILTCHQNDWKARTWSLQRKAIGNHILASLSSTPDSSEARPVRLTKEGLPSFGPQVLASKYKKPSTSLTAVNAPTLSTCAVSACGNFGLLGTFDGKIVIYNMQSGLHKKTIDTGSQKAVTGLATDATSSLIYSCGLDGKFRAWSQSSGTVVSEIDLGFSAAQLEVAPSGIALVAVSCDDFGVRVIDTDAFRVVRDFDGPRAAVTDFCFSSDSRHLVVTSMDSSIRTFDIASGQLIDVMRVPSLPTSVAYSPRGEYLVTTHVGQLGVFLWLNKSIYSMNLSRYGRAISAVEEDAIFSRPLAVTMEALPFALIDMPEADSDISSDGEDELDTSHLASDEMFASADQLNERLITLSQQSGVSRWSSLLNLELIRMRNKPIEPPKAPEKAPFFMSTTSGLAPKFVKDQQSTVPAASSAVSRPQTQGSIVLLQCSESGRYDNYISYMLSQNLSSIDLEIRSLVPTFVSSSKELELLVCFLNAILWSLKTKRQYDATESLLGAFLKIHHETIREGLQASEPLKLALGAVLNERNKLWESLQVQFRKTISSLEYLRSI